MRDRIVGFFMSKIFGFPFCYSLYLLLDNYSKVLGILQCGEGLILKREAACIISTTVVSNVHNSVSSRLSLLIEAMLLHTQCIPSTRGLSET